ncbi:MAG: PEP-CTERM sorting domain-containing protein [Thiohalocapsa sp. PB-PSB1]|jgi:hypothetical protein|nr:MAG: hypothetical protein N838_31360 [Thiohalocapsa sp. PB-PSB1]QQO52462.1 MAG: PEP-CTERM sorting domain-containing protein [Thiohalocapsa sp. PB-PSB1]
MNTFFARRPFAAATRGAVLLAPLLLATDLLHNQAQAALATFDVQLDADVSLLSGPIPPTVFVTYVAEVTSSGGTTTGSQSSFFSDPLALPDQPEPMQPGDLTTQGHSDSGEAGADSGSASSGANAASESLGTIVINNQSNTEEAFEFDYSLSGAATLSLTGLNDSASGFAQAAVEILIDVTGDLVAETIIALDESLLITTATGGFDIDEFDFFGVTVPAGEERTINISVATSGGAFAARAAPVPAPASAALLAVGLLGVAGLRRHRHRVACLSERT